jgi:RNA-dependent RNA polymerase
MRVAARPGLIPIQGLCVVANDIPYNILPTVWVTPSQIKIKYSPTVCDPAHLVVDVLRASHMKSPCRLSVEVIINLAENGVPESAFTTLLETSLTEIITPLLDWDSPNACPTLWMVVQSLGGVLAARRARENAGTARVNGFSERDNDETELDDEDGFTQLDFAEQRSAAWWADPISGCPSSLEETVMALLDSGFTPNNCAYLREKLNKVIKSAIKKFVKTYRMEVPMSCSAWIVPGGHF